LIHTRKSDNLRDLGKINPQLPFDVSIQTLRHLQNN